jgi:hypothetical protein
MEVAELKGVYLLLSLGDHFSSRSPSRDKQDNSVFAIYGYRHFLPSPLPSAAAAVPFAFACVGARRSRANNLDGCTCCYGGVNQTGLARAGARESLRLTGSLSSVEVIPDFGEGKLMKWIPLYPA